MNRGRRVPSPFGLLLLIALVSLADRLANPLASSIADAPSVQSHGDPLRFEQFPSGRVFHGTPARIITAQNATAARFHTVIQDSAQLGPNFAGHYRLAEWGCGASCIQLAVVDLRTGAVTSLPGIETITASASAIRNQDQCPPTPSLFYKPTSTLLVAVGTANEDPARNGLHFYQWNGKSLILLRFLPTAHLSCEAQRAALPN